MARRKKSKQSRGSRGFRQSPCLHDPVTHRYLDLFVPLPKSSSAAEEQIQSQLLLSQVMNRLAVTGYSTAAVTHTIYGRPRTGVDDPKQVFPSSLLSAENDNLGGGTKRPDKRRRTEPETKSSVPPICVLKRLHAVVENVSDVSAYALVSPLESDSPRNTTLSLLEEYDIVSVSPRNDATFQACCASATCADIVTLDYTSGRGGVQLPFRIRPADVRALVDRQAVLELPYAPALLHNNVRKALVQTARELQMASVSVRPKPGVIFSSGDRTMGDKDIGAMALRSPGDLINVLQTVLRFDQGMAYDAMSASATAVLMRAQQRRKGGREGNVTVEVHVGTKETNYPSALPSKRGSPGYASTPGDHEKKSADEEVEDNIEDGFITLT